ncbi:hypothetical protein C8J57DRAFT_1215950 [Mycena rebaudengoi]|nr:hypothetical protein C8J57DRAFT_1215950 [Mycena rebaudengoi]
MACVICKINTSTISGLRALNYIYTDTLSQYYSQHCAAELRVIVWLSLYMWEVLWKESVVGMWKAHLPPVSSPLPIQAPFDPGEMELHPGSMVWRKLLNSLDPKDTKRIAKLRTYFQRLATHCFILRENVTRRTRAIILQWMAILQGLWEITGQPHAYNLGASRRDLHHMALGCFNCMEKDRFSQHQHTFVCMGLAQQGISLDTIYTLDLAPDAVLIKQSELQLTYLLDPYNNNPNTSTKYLFVMTEHYQQLKADSEQLKMIFEEQLAAVEAQRSATSHLDMILLVKFYIMCHVLTVLTLADLLFRLHYICP